MQQSNYVSIENQKRYFKYIYDNKLFNIYDDFIFSHDDIKKIYVFIKNFYLKNNFLPDIDLIVDNTNFTYKSISLLVNYNITVDEKWLVFELQKQYKITKADFIIKHLIDQYREGNYDLVFDNLKDDLLPPTTKIDKIDIKNSSLNELQDWKFKLSCSAPADVIDILTETFDPTKKYDEKKYLFYPLIRQGQLVMIFGQTGDGKSAWAVELANQIAEGETKWDLPFKIDTKSQSVVYLDFELGASSFQHRYNSTKFSQNLIIENVDVYNYNSYIGLDNKTNVKIDRAIQFIEDIAKKHKSKVIFVDNLSNIADQVEQAKDADRFISDLYGRMKALDLTIIFLGHTPKIPTNCALSINQLKGSSSLTKTFESIIGFKRSINKNESYIKQLKYRQLDCLFDDENVATFYFENDTPVGWNMKYIGKDTEENLIGEKNKNGRPIKFENIVKYDVVYEKLVNNKTYNDLCEHFNVSHGTICNIMNLYKNDKHFKENYEEWLETKKELF